MNVTLDFPAEGGQHTRTKKEFYVVSFATFLLMIYKSEDR